MKSSRHSPPLSSDPRAVVCRGCAQRLYPDEVCGCGGKMGAMYDPPLPKRLSKPGEGICCEIVLKEEPKPCVLGTDDNGERSYPVNKKLGPADMITMSDGRQRPRIVVIMTSTMIGHWLNKSYDEATAMAQAAFNKLHTADHYPTTGEILKECGIDVDPREDKPWPADEDCQGCDRHKDGPHRFGCSIHGARQPKFYASTTEDGRLQVDIPKPPEKP